MPMPKEEAPPHHKTEGPELREGDPWIPTGVPRQAVPAQVLLPPMAHDDHNTQRPPDPVGHATI